MIKDVINEAKAKMQSTLSVFQEDLSGIRSGRASTGLVDKIVVEYYGQPMEMRKIANISTPEPMQILIRPFDKAAVKPIEKALQEANLGINPNVDDINIRLNMPPLTRDRRQELVKVVHRRTEEARVAIRNVRRSANDDLKDFEKEKMISEDEMHTGEEQVQKLTDDFIKKIEGLANEKEQEILEV